MKNLIPLFILIMSGCVSAQLVKNPDGGVNGPSSGTKPGGIVRFDNSNYDYMRGAREKDAFKKMKSHCGGDYKIVDQGLSKSANQYASMGIITSVEYYYFKFECGQ